MSDPATTVSLRDCATQVRNTLYPNRADVRRLCREAARAADVIDGLRGEVERLRASCQECGNLEGGMRS